MKSLFISFVLLVLVSCNAMAAQPRLEKTCLQDIDDQMKYSISVSLEINPETGTTKSMRSLTIFTENKYCFGSLSRNDGSYALPVSPKEIRTQLKCYKNLKSSNGHHYLLNEWVNVNTGMTVHLAYINEFDSEDACRSNL